VNASSHTTTFTDVVDDGNIINAHTMDSQLTLINPSPPPFLILSKVSVKNTSIYLSTNPETPLYHVTSDNHNHNTHIQDAHTQCIIMSVQQKELLPDVIVFLGTQDLVRNTDVIQNLD
jgi:hypothetical protein